MLSTYKGSSLCLEGAERSASQFSGPMSAILLVSGAPALLHEPSLHERASPVPSEPGLLLFLYKVGSTYLGNHQVYEASLLLAVSSLQSEARHEVSVILSQNSNPFQGEFPPLFHIYSISNRDDNCQYCSYFSYYHSCEEYYGE